MEELLERFELLSRPEGMSLADMARLVPAPDDLLVDLREAEVEYGRDAVRCDLVLRGEPSWEDLFCVQETTMRWCQFWAQRHLDPALREIFRLSIECRERIRKRSANMVSKIMRKRLARGRG
jgi:hypothetical protein